MPNGIPTPPEVVAMVNQLRDEGLLYREIAVRTGLSETTLRNLATKSSPPRRSPQKRPKPQKPQKRPPRLAPIVSFDGSRKVRCEKCGAKVYLPCLVCQVRARLELHGRT